MQERSPVSSLAVEPSVLLKTDKSEIIQEGAHGRKIRRRKPDMRDILNLDHRHCALLGNQYIDYLVRYLEFDQTVN